MASPGADIVPWIPADHHFTTADNALEQEWFGTVWCNPPYGRETLPQWLEKFRQHGNGIALVVDRTSTGWWQTLCGHADLILQLNKKIQYIRPDDDRDPGNNALGSSLVAYGEKAVQALMNAAAAGLGTLFKPCPVPTSRAVENNSERYWLTPPELYDQLNDEFQFDFDACPHPRPENFDSLEVPWGEATYVNPPFHRINSQGPTAFARKAIEQSKLGKTVVLILPAQSYVNLLLEAGAELRSAGRVKWLVADTGQPLSSPSPITCFILRGKSVASATRYRSRVVSYPTSQKKKSR